MVQAEARDAAHRWPFDNVRCVKPPTKPDFEDASVCRRPRECEDCGRGSDLEEARLDPLSRRDYLFEQRSQRLVIDQSAGDADAFVEADEMRACEGVDLVPACFERGAEEGDG